MTTLDVVEQMQHLLVQAPDKNGEQRIHASSTWQFAGKTVRAYLLEAWIDESRPLRDCEIAWAIAYD